jgi:hypothetical protein
MSAPLTRLSLRTVPTLKVLVAQRASILSGPPRVHISNGEKFGCAMLLIAGIITPSGWILTHVKHYRHRDWWSTVGIKMSDFILLPWILLIAVFWIVENFLVKTIF